MSRQIVITLPEWTEIKQIDNKQFADLLPAYDEMLNMIKNGTPLPKGQGVLKAEKIAMLEELKMEIEEEKTDTKHLHYDDLENAESYNNGIDNSIDVIQTRIDKLKEDKE